MARGISRIIDEQVKRWHIEQREKPKTKRAKFQPPNVITVSNAIGSNGIMIAKRVGKLLGIPVYDREIVEHIATTKKVRIDTVESLDQRAQSRLDDYLTNLFRDRNFDRGDYMQGLTRAVMGLWGHGSCVFIGRGTAHIVYRKNALIVRTVGSIPHRIRRVQDEEGIDRAEADRRIRRMDAERESFIRKYFDANISDPLHYDLVLNTSGFDTDGAAQVIVEAYQRKFSGK